MQPASTGRSVISRAASIEALMYCGTRPARSEGTGRLSMSSGHESRCPRTAGTSSRSKAMSAPKASASTVRSIITVAAAEGYLSARAFTASACTRPSLTASSTVRPVSSMPGWVIIGTAATRRSATSRAAHSVMLVFIFQGFSLTAWEQSYCIFGATQKKTPPIFSPARSGGATA